MFRFIQKQIPAKRDLLFCFLIHILCEKGVNMLLIIKFLGGAALANILFYLGKQAALKATELRGYYNADIAEKKPRKRLLILGGILTAILL